MLELFDTLDIIDKALDKSTSPEEMIEFLRLERQRVEKNILNIESEMYAEYEKDQQ